MKFRMKRKTRKTIGVLLLTLSLVAAVFYCIPMSGSAKKDKGNHYYKIYSDLSLNERDSLMKRDGGGYEDYSYLFYFFNPDPVDVKLGHVFSNGKGDYGTQIRDTRKYYVKYREENRITGYGEWYVTEIRTDEQGEYAVVDYRGDRWYLTVPTRIDYNGRRYDVRGLALENHYVRYVDMHNTIQYIYACRSVDLRGLKGVDEVTYIGPGAFENCVRLKTFPMMEKLECIENLAFSGCLSLMDVPLGDNLYWIDADAFGWYDVIIGNYDYGNTSNDEIGYEAGFLDNDRIHGVTLYANQNSPTHFMLFSMIDYSYQVEPVYNPDTGNYDSKVIDKDYVEFMCSHWNLKDMSEYALVEQEPFEDVDYANVPGSEVYISIFPGYDFGGGSDDDGQTGGDDDSDIDDAEKKGWEDFADFLMDLLKKGAISVGVMLSFFLVFGRGSIENMEMTDQALVKICRENGVSEATIRQIVEYYGKMDNQLSAKGAKHAIEYMLAGAEAIDANMFVKIFGAGAKASLKFYELVNSGVDPEQAMTMSGFGGVLDVANTCKSDLLAPILGKGAVAPLRWWDLAVKVGLGSTEGGDAVSFAGNLEHTADVVIEFVNSLMEPNWETKVTQIAQRMLDGAYGPNMKQFATLVDLCGTDANGLTGWDNMIIGIKDMGARNFLEGICKTANEVLIYNEKTNESNLVGQYLLKIFNENIVNLTAGGWIK